MSFAKNMMLMLCFHSRFPSGCKCYSQRLSETYNFMLVRSEAREAEVVGEEEQNTPRQLTSGRKKRKTNIFTREGTRGGGDSLTREGTKGGGDSLTREGTEGGRRRRRI